MLISWPAFTAADGTPVAAGSTSVALGNDGALSVNLVPNAGSTPSGTYYTAVFQLQDVVRTEYWLVGTTSPTTLSAVRATPGVGVATPPVSKLGMAAQAVTEAGSAAAANGVNIALDAQLIADIKALIPAIEQYAKSVGVAKPAGAVTPPATVPAK